MSPPEGRNLEHRSSGAMICLCLGLGLCALTYFLGIGAILTVFLPGGPPMAIERVLPAIGLALMTIVGVGMTLIGGIWMIGQVIADQSGGAEEKRYRDVER